MDELVFYEARANAIFGAIGTAVFLLAGSATVVGGFVIAAGHTGNADGGYLLVIIGGMVALVFGYFFVQSVRSIRAPERLRLTADGFDLVRIRSRRRLPLRTNRRRQSHLVLQGDMVARGQTASSGQAQSALGEGGSVHPSAAHRGGPIRHRRSATVEILRRWKQGDRTAVRSHQVPSAERLASESGHTGPTLTIPPKRGDTIGALAFVAPLFLGFAVGGPALALTERADHAPWQWITAAAIWPLRTAFFGAGVYYLVRELRKPGLVPCANGFEFDGPT